LVVSPHDKFVASSDGSAVVIRDVDGILDAGSGECLPELPEGGSPVAATDHRDDLQAGDSSLPIENKYGNQVDTIQINTTAATLVSESRNFDRGLIFVKDTDILLSGDKWTTARHIAAIDATTPGWNH
jgi:hypothetical protein